MNADTLLIDSTHLQAWTTNADYDYSRETAQSGSTLLGQLMSAIDSWLERLFSGMGDGVNTQVWTTIGIITLVLVVTILFIRYPQLFGRRNKKFKDEEDKATEDTIYGVDFEGDIRRAAAAHNWREAVRLTYLHALRLLHDGGRIDWQPYKTPTQYTREVTSADFRTFTNHFLRIRYGGFEATEELFDTMRSLMETIVRNAPQKGGDA